MKYKVGDKVKVRSDLEVDKDYDGVRFVELMEKYKGEMVTIAEVLCNNRYNIKEDNKEWFIKSI